jgi:hypothetical protein
MAEISAETGESRALSRDLKKRGFSFVGPTIAYAFMQSAGLVNDHLVSCFRYAGYGSLAESRPWMEPPTPVSVPRRQHPDEADAPGASGGTRRTRCTSGSTRTRTGVAVPNATLAITTPVTDLRTISSIGPASRQNNSRRWSATAGVAHQQEMPRVSPPPWRSSVRPPRTAAAAGTPRGHATRIPGGGAE